MNAGKRTRWRRRSLSGIITQTCAPPECVAGVFGARASPFAAGPAGDDVAHEEIMAAAGRGGWFRGF